MAVRAPHNPYIQPARGAVMDEQHPLAPDVLCLLINEGDGLLKLRDLTRHGAVGSLLGGDVTWIAGRQGWAINLPATGGDYVTLGDAPQFTPGASGMTLLTWLRSTAATTYRGIVSKRESAGTMEWMLYIDSPAGSVAFAVKSVTQKAESSVTINDGNWHQVVGWWDGSDCKIYVDGVERGTVSAPTAPSDSSDALCLGIYDNSAYWAGDIATLQMWSRPLRLAEIQQLHREPYCFVRTPAPSRYSVLVPVVGDVTAYPSALALTGAQGTPTVLFDWKHEIAAALSLTGAPLDPTVLYDCTVALGQALTIAATTDDPTVLYDYVVEIAAALGLTGAQNDPTIFTGIIVEIGQALALTGALNDPSILYDYAVQITAALALAAAANDPTVILPSGATDYPLLPELGRTRLRPPLPHVGDPNVQRALQQLDTWLERELSAMALRVNRMMQGHTDGKRFSKRATIPGDAQDGDVEYFAAGVAGANEGLYCRESGSWSKL